MRKAILAMVGFLALLMFVPVVQAAPSQDWLGLDLLDRGAIAVQYKVKADVKTKLMIAKGQNNYIYSLSSDKQREIFPLQMGNGDYQVTVLEQTSGTKYKVVQSAAVTLQLTDNSKVFLNAVQNVDWSEGDEAAQLAQKLTQSAKSDEEKVRAIHKYIIGTIQYDKALAADDLTDYLPDNKRTIADAKGICYDYASLFAAMLRSVDIPAKLVMGTSEYVDVYHAWNEVYLDGQWVTIDTTVDASWQNGGVAFNMVKDASKYTAAKYF